MYLKILYKILNDVNIRDYCCCGPVRHQHFRKKINMNVKEMNVNSTLNQQKLEGKPALRSFLNVIFRICLH